MALSGKVALVTGAAQGIGKGFSDILLKNGANVALLDTKETVGKTTKASFDEVYGEDRTIFLPCDVVSDEQLKDAFQKTVERFGRIDIVCNNAGIADETDWGRTVDVNLKGVIRGTYLALQYMRKENGGSGGVIVNTASLAGLSPVMFIPVYSATKHGIIGFTRSVADGSKASRYGVRINALCPAAVNTTLAYSQGDCQRGPFGHLEEARQQALQKSLMLEVPVVAEAFLQLVLDKDKHGAALVLNQSGANYFDFPQLF